MAKKKIRDLSLVDRQKICEAFDFIDKNGVPDKNEAREVVVIYNNKQYPVKYTLAVAWFLQFNGNIDTNDFVTADAIEVLIQNNFMLSYKSSYQLTITKDGVVSTDDDFTMEELSLGDKCVPRMTCFIANDGRVVYREKSKNEKSITNQTMPRIAFQLYEKDILGLSKQERLDFPTCQYRPNGHVYKGIYDSAEEMSEYINSFNRMEYRISQGGKFVIYSWNIFTTIMFVQECLKRFGAQGDKFVLFYDYKEGKNNAGNEGKGNSMSAQETTNNEPPKEWKPLKDEDDKNYPHNRIIFGAPGTGKSHKLEKETENIKEVVTRVTFHPDYSYAHFVGTYKPVMEKTSDGKEEIKYKFIPGPFLNVYKKARKNPAENYVLIIEEINRANVAAVFGDVFQLLDRKDNGESEYPIDTSKDIQDWLTEKNKETKTENAFSEEEAKKLSIPRNMYIWATMNSADQGVYPMDTAFKRRWTFEYMDIDGDGDKAYENFEVTIGATKYNWKDLRKAINDTLLDANINEDKCLGPYFIKGNTDNKEFASKVLMYLFEDVVKQKPSKIFNEELKGFSKIYSKSTTDGKLEDIFVNNIITKYTESKGNE